VRDANVAAPGDASRERDDVKEVTEERRKV